MSTLQKTCSTCGEDKHLSEFYTRSNKCKSCTKAAVTANRLLNLERVQDYDRQRRRKSNLSEEDWEERLQISREYVKNNPELRSVTCARYVEKNPKKRSAHILVGNSIRSGKLIPEVCSVCGCAEVHAHHCDYDKPLEVDWLCSEHHNDWHREHGEGLNGV